MINDALLIKIAREIERRWVRKNYEALLVELDLYSLSTLKDDDEYYKLSNYNLILETLRTHAVYDTELLYEINKRRTFSKEIISDLTDAGVDLEQIEKEFDSEKVVHASQREAKLAENVNSKREAAKPEEIRKKEGLAKRAKVATMSRITAPHAAIIAAIIGLFGIVIGAILNPLASKWINEPEPRPDPKSLAIEQIPYTIYPFEGNFEPSCCVGEADFEFTNDSNLHPLYSLNYTLPENETKRGYAGISFVFKDSQNLSEYKAIGFTIIFDTNINEADVSIEDIKLTDTPFHITGSKNESNSIVVPLSNFKDVDLKAVRSIEFEVHSSYTSGNHWFAIRDILLTK